MRSGGLPIALNAIDSESLSIRIKKLSSPSGGISGGIISAVRASCWGQADVKVEAQGLRDLLAEVGAKSLSCYAPQDLAQKPAVRESVISVLRAGLPPGLLPGESVGHNVPLEC